MEYLEFVEPFNNKQKKGNFCCFPVYLPSLLGGQVLEISSPQLEPLSVSLFFLSRRRNKAKTSLILEKPNLFFPCQEVASKREKVITWCSSAFSSVWTYKSAHAHPSRLRLNLSHLLIYVTFFPAISFFCNSTPLFQGGYQIDSNLCYLLCMNYAIIIMPLYCKM